MKKIFIAFLLLITFLCISSEAEAQTQRTRAYLHGRYETGDRPTQTDYRDVFATFFSRLEDSLSISVLYGVDTISNDVTLADSSTVALVTEAAVKGYVDAAAGSVTAGDKGDITVGASWTIDNDAVDAAAIAAGAVGTSEIANNSVANADLATMATNTLKGNDSGGTATPQDLTISEAKTMLAIGSTDVTDFEEAVEDLVGANIVAGTGATVSYDDGTGNTTISISNFSVGSYSDIISLTSVSLGDRIKVRDSGAEYVVRSSGIDGWTTDSVLQIPVNSLFATYDPLESIPVSHAIGADTDAEGLQRALNYASILSNYNRNATTGVKSNEYGSINKVVIDKKLELTDTIEIPAGCLIEGMNPPTITAGVAIGPPIIANINDATKALFTIKGINATAYGQANGLKNVQIFATSPARTAIHYEKHLSPILDGIWVDGNTSRFFTNGIELTDGVYSKEVGGNTTYITRCSENGLYFYNPSNSVSVGTSTYVKNISVTYCKHGITVDSLAYNKLRFENLAFERIDSAVIVGGFAFKAWFNGIDSELSPLDTSQYFLDLGDFYNTDFNNSCDVLIHNSRFSGNDVTNFAKLDRVNNFIVSNSKIEKFTNTLNTGQYMRNAVFEGCNFISTTNTIMDQITGGGGSSEIYDTTKIQVIACKETSLSAQTVLRNSKIYSPDVFTTSSSGQVFKSNGTSSAASMQDPFPGVTANYLMKASSTTALSNSLIRDDGSTIGINSAPSSELVLMAKNQDAATTLRVQNASNTASSRSQLSIGGAGQAIGFLSCLSSYGTANFAGKGVLLTDSGLSGMVFYNSLAASSFEFQNNATNSLLEITNAGKIQSGLITDFLMSASDSAKIAGSGGAITINSGFTRFYEGSTVRMQISNSTGAISKVLPSNISSAYSVTVSGAGNVLLHDSSTGAQITTLGNATSGAKTILDSEQTELSGRLETAKGSDVASATNVTLGNDGNFFTITGTTTINTIVTTNWQAGSEITLLFAASVTVNDNGTSAGNLILAGNVDFSATAADVLKLVTDGTDWYEVSRSVN